MICLVFVVRLSSQMQVALGFRIQLATGEALKNARHLE
jgi:hypothetical protein